MSLESECKELAEALRRLAANARTDCAVTNVRSLMMFYDGRRDAFEQAAEMVEVIAHGIAPPTDSVTDL